MTDGAFDPAHTFVHLGLGAAATPLPDFAWSPEYLDAYAARFAADGDEGRLVCVSPQASTWDTWERHPAGDEVVVLLSGRIDVIQESEGRQRVVELRAGEAMVNPRNVWHTTRVHEPGQALFITPGAGTEHRPHA
jgi:uncharacterized cupin superfamily protein